MNSFPNFMGHVEDEGEVFDIHFVALFSENPDAIPVISSHVGQDTNCLPNFRTECISL